MRCCECEIEPLTPGHYCECCGRKLSLQERKALETATIAPVDVHAAHALSQGSDRLVGVHFDPQPTIDPVPEAHAAGHPLVDPSLEAHFAGQAPVEPAPTVRLAAPAVVDSWQSPVVAGQVPLDALFVDVSGAHVDSDAPSDRCEICGVPAQGEPLCTTCQHTYQSLLESKPAPSPTETTVAPAPEQAPPAVIAAEVSVQQASQTPAEPIRILVRPPLAPPELDAPAAPSPSPAPAPAPKAARPVQPVAEAAAPTPPQSSRARTVAAGGLVVVALAAIGFPLGKLWLGHQEVAPIVREEPASPPVAEVAAPAVTPPRVVPASATARTESESATTRTESSVQAPPKAVAAVTAAPVPPKPGVAPRPAAARVPTTKTTVKPNVKPNVPARPVALVAPNAATVAPAPEVAAPAPVAVAAPKPEPPAAPVGPFFELRDVNEAPRVASRIDPQVPDDMRDRSLNEVVIVRVLVTQAGHPLIVNLLRRSKAGTSLDDAIVAAVKQWTFVPARKRGEPVSCWYHVGVPVIRAH